jgi:cobalamin biosynthesis protein CobW
VAMQSAVLRVASVGSRQQIESLLPGLIAAQNLLRLKGRAWLPGKTVPLQIQAVGPRLDCWFDTAYSGERPAADGLELVALGLAIDAALLQQELENSCAQP